MDILIFKDIFKQVHGMVRITSLATLPEGWMGESWRLGVQEDPMRWSREAMVVAQAREVKW